MSSLQFWVPCALAFAVIEGALLINGRQTSKFSGRYRVPYGAKLLQVFGQIRFKGFVQNFFTKPMGGAWWVKIKSQAFGEAVG